MTVLKTSAAFVVLQGACGPPGSQGPRGRKGDVGVRGPVGKD